MFIHLTSLRRYHVTKHQKAAGYFRSGLPYTRLGNGPRILVVLQGLLLENKPLSGLLVPAFAYRYQFLAKEYTMYVVTRKPGLPAGYSMQDMGDDYATMIEQEFGGPVDILGPSTGGSVAQHLTADHPDVVRRLVLHSSAYALRDAAREAQMCAARLARQRKWREAGGAMLGIALSFSRFGKIIAGVEPVLMPLIAPDDPSDLIVTIEAEDKHNFKDRLAEIVAPTLVIGGDRDPFYSETLFRETAAGIPNAKLIVYPGKGHPVGGKKFKQDVLTFLRESMV
jgi:pimeloyl-ACP methyl ester carboxylesterase